MQTSFSELDKAIDRALEALRADAPNQADCEAAMAALLRTFDTPQGKTRIQIPSATPVS